MKEQKQSRAFLVSRAGRVAANNLASLMDTDLSDVVNSIIAVEGGKQLLIYEISNKQQFMLPLSWTGGFGDKARLVVTLEKRNENILNTICESSDWKANNLLDFWLVSTYNSLILCSVVSSDGRIEFSIETLMRSIENARAGKTLLDAENKGLAKLLRQLCIGELSEEDRKEINVAFSVIFNMKTELRGAE